MGVNGRVTAVAGGSSVLVVVRSEQGPSDLAGEVVGGLSMARGAQHRLHLGAPARLAALALVLQCSDEPRPLAVVGEILEATRGRCGGQRTNLRRTVDAIRWVLHAERQSRCPHGANVVGDVFSRCGVEDEANSRKLRPFTSVLLAVS